MHTSLAGVGPPYCSCAFREAVFAVDTIEARVFKNGRAIKVVTVWVCVGGQGYLSQDVVLFLWCIRAFFVAYIVLRIRTEAGRTARRTYLMTYKSVLCERLLH